MQNAHTKMHIHPSLLTMIDTLMMIHQVCVCTYHPTLQLRAPSNTTWERLLSDRTVGLYTFLCEANNKQATVHWCNGDWGLNHYFELWQ